MKTRTDFVPSPAAEAARQRLTALAASLSAALAGEAVPAEGEPVSPLAAALTMGMVLFVARLDPADIAALYTGPGSLADIPAGPLPAVRRGRSPLAPLFAMP